MPVGGGNPFWSEKATTEFRLAISRPMDLPPERYPVPGDDEEVRRQLEQEEEQDFAAVENGSEERGRRRSRSRLGTPMAEMAFTTPESWMNQGAVTGGPLRTAGRMPEEGAEGSQARGGEPLRSQGAVFQADHGGDDLQREVEKEVVRTLQEENEQLRRKMQELMQKMEEKSGNSDWSEVSAGSPRLRKGAADRREEVRYTPNGTQVPTGPPPVTMEGDRPPVPPWPFPDWEVYEKDEGGHTRRMEIDSREWQLHRGLYGGGASSRHTDCGRGTGSRQEVRHQEVEGSLGDPQVDRERWLMRELVQLQQALDSEKRSKVRSRVDQEGHLREVPLSRADHHGRQGQVPLCRAGQPGKGEQAPLSRASYQGLNEGDRAWQPQHGDLRDNRAWQAQQADGGRDHRYRGEDPGVATGSGSQDQGGNHRTVELPELSGGDLTPLILGDWMEVVKPLMMDLSPQASRWWVLVVEESYRYYNEWRRATPMERLRISPESVVVRMDPTLHRTEQRGISLLLKAIPLSVKETVIAERLLSTTGILFTLLKNFQPGGSSERTLLLKELSEIKVGKSPNEACAAVRSWRRFYTRTKEIEATVPDPIILLRALEPAVQLISQLDAQATFRLAQSRAQLQVDARPEESSVWSYSECLLAELESLRLLQGSTATSNSGSTATTTPAVKMLGTKSSTTSACKFWGSDTGCRQGKRCSYLHDWASLEDRNNRCFLCSSTAHRKADCPTRAVGESTNPTGGSGGGGPKGKGNGKNKSKTKPGGEESAASTKGKGNGNGAGSSTPQSSSGLQEASLKAMQGTGAPSSAESVAGSTTSKPESLATEKELMGEVASLLKTLRVGDGNSNPQLSAVRLARILNQDKAVLIDGGATHCLRNPHSREEYLNHAEEVRVDLAAGSVRMRQDTGTGTLYSEDPNLQPIVPLADVIKVGVVVKWDSSGCEMRYRSGEKLPVFLQDGCPMLPMLRGMELLYEVEEFNRRKMKLRRAVTHPQPDRDREEEFMSRLARLFPEVPLRILERVPGKLNYDNDIMAINRRTRRQVERAETVILNLFSGPNTKIWTSHGQKGLLILNVEVLKGTDLLESNFYGYLEAQARFGRFSAIYAGPPCKTVSFCRFGHDQDGGPPPLRAREGALRFGLPWISPEQQEEADIDSTLWIKTLWLIHLARGSRSDFLFMVEQPRDPKEWREDDYALHGGHGYPSFLCWPETDRVMIAYSDVIEVRVDQGALGHKRKKPTTLVTNIHEVKLMNGLQDNSVQRPWPTSLQARMEESRSLAEWAPELKNLLLSVAIRVHRGQPPLRLRTTVPRMNALTAAERKDMEMWQNHINQEHLPMRRDCHDCLLAMGRDRPRRRQVCPASYCLSIDVAGPFEPGVDQLAGNPRYFLIGCYTLPVSQGVALTEAIGKLGGQVKMTPLDEGEEKDGIVLGEYYDYHLEENEKALAELDQVDTYLAGMEQQMELQHEEEEERNIFSETELDPPRLASENVPNQEDVQAPEDPPQGELDGVFVERREKPEEALPEVLVRELDLQNARWKNKIAELKEVEVVNLTLAVPLRSRHAPEVLRAVSSLYVRLRGLGLPIYRLHSDRAREFTGKLMRDWILSHDMEHTTTAADESAGNGRVESEIAHLKHHTKLLLTTARAPPTYWPMALRHASEYRLRKTLEQLGVPVPRLIPFGTEAIAKSKFWHRTMKGFPTPMQKVKVWGPAVGMSLSSKGYWIEADGKWMRSTVVVQPGARPDLRPELPLEERAENLDNASIAMSEDQPDVVATNQADEAGHPVVNLENIDQDDQVQWVPKRRFHMKKPLIPGSEDATLRMRMLCSNRGECSQEEALDNAWATLEHLHLRKLETEERQLTTGDQQSMEVIAQLEEQCKNIEKNMEDQKASREGREGEAVVEEEVLVNQPVSLEEVRRNLPQWKEALKKEYDSLIGYGAIRPIGSKEYAELQEQYEVVESIPTMLVAVKKPPLKLKARVVACGNHAQEATGCTTAGGVDTVVVRTLVSLAAHKDLTILTSDIKTAFLQAPRRLTPGRVTILTPPAILREAQLLQLQGERWVVEKAMYGLTESPKDWGDFRNLRMSSMKWSSQGFQRWLRRSPEPHLWEVCQQDVVAEESQPSVICHVAVYVDDLMVTGKREDAREVMDQLAKTFQMTSPEEVSESQEVTFCGYQIQKTETGFALHQQKYVQEVLQKHGIQCSESVPCLKISDGPEEQDPAREDIKQAQIVTGELGWLTSRTRPDLAFSVSIMARMIHKRPKWVTETGMQVLKYLHGSKGWGLNYTRIDDPTVLNVLVDASYAPPHEGYRSVQGAIYMHGSNVLMWSSSRQGFITQSTAEAELLAYNESAQGAESVAHLLECFDMKVARRLIGDSKSGLVQLTGEVGSWRTRHLRLRSAKLRELIQHGVDGWHAVHRDGKELAADGMTKPLAGQAFVRFRSMLFMKDCDKKDAKENTICIPAVKTCYQVDSSTSLRDLGCGLLGAGSALLATGNKKLALALVASGVALCWKEGGKRPASKAIEQRPHKSPENEGGKGQTMLGKGGAAHLKEESRAGTTEEVSKSMRIQELETVGRSPGLRAYRVTGAGSRSSHGSSSSAGPSTSADPSTEERRGLSVPPRLSPFPEGALFDDASGLLEQGQQVPRQRRALTEDERRQLNREMRERIQSLEERVDRLTLEGESVRKNPEETVVKNEMKSERRYEGMQRALVPADGTVEQPPWKGSRTTSSAAASSGGVGPVIQQGIGWWPQIPQAVVGGPPCSQWSENVESEKPKAPWSRDRFQFRPTGAERWDMSLLEEGWIVRVHSKTRKRRYHPLHSSVPVDARELQGLRVTKRFLVDGRMIITQDHWTGENRTDDNMGWSGYTFLKLSSAPSDDDGSYEMIDPED